jgi:hypothetical protein
MAVHNERKFDLRIQIQIQNLTDSLKGLVSASSSMLVEIPWVSTVTQKKKVCVL